MGPVKDCRAWGRLGSSGPQAQRVVNEILVLGGERRKVTLWPTGALIIIMYVKPCLL